MLVFGGVSETNLFLLFLVISIRLPPKIYHMMVQGFKVFPVFSRLLLIHIECFKQNIQNHQKQSKKHVFQQLLLFQYLKLFQEISSRTMGLLMDFWWIYVGIDPFFPSKKSQKPQITQLFLVPKVDLWHLWTSLGLPALRVNVGPHVRRLLIGIFFVEKKTARQGVCRKKLWKYLRSNDK